MSMKEVNLLIWMTQLGLSVALPLIGFAFLGVWLNQSCGFGSWTVWTGLILGILSGVNGFRSSLHAMKLMAKDKKTQSPPPVSFNDHI